MLTSVTRFVSNERRPGEATPRAFNLAQSEQSERKLTMSDRWNLPPGITPDMIPGNRPEDELFERLWDRWYCDPELFRNFLLNYLKAHAIIVHELATWEDINAFLDNTPDLRQTFDDWLGEHISDCIRDGCDAT